MLAAIPPVSLPSITPAAAPASSTVAVAPAPAAQPEQSLVERFSALMQNADTTAQTRIQPHGQSALNQFVSSQDSAINNTLEKAQSFSISESQSMQQVAVSVVHMQTEMAMLSFKLNVANGLAQSGKSSVQTLMKNQ